MTINSSREALVLNSRAAALSRHLGKDHPRTQLARSDALEARIRDAIREAGDILNADARARLVLELQER